METIIGDYERAKRDLESCMNWASLIGKPYRGGGGGVGELCSIKLMLGESRPTVYHQDRDGGKNYHLMPPALTQYLESAIKKRIVELLNDALVMQKADVVNAAQKALDKHAELLRAAGLVTSEQEIESREEHNRIRSIY